MFLPNEEVKICQNVAKDVESEQGACFLWYVWTPPVSQVNFKPFHFDSDDRFLCQFFFKHGDNEMEICWFRERRPLSHKNHSQGFKDKQRRSWLRWLRGSGLMGLMGLLMTMMKHPWSLPSWERSHIPYKFSGTFWVDDVPNFPRWDMDSFPEV